MLTILQILFLLWAWGVIVLTLVALVWGARGDSVDATTLPQHLYFWGPFKALMWPVTLWSALADWRRGERYWLGWSRGDPRDRWDYYRRREGSGQR